MSKLFSPAAAELQLFVVLALLGAAPLSAQRVTFSPTPRAHFSSNSAPANPTETVVIGTVRDTIGQPISNVRVVVSGVDRVALTDNKGEFAFRGLPPGTYHLDLVRIGFAAEHAIVTLPVDGPPVRVNVVMRIATVRLSSVSVTATPTGTDPLNVTQATVQLSGKELQRSLSASIGATLSGEPGMSSRYNGPVASAPVIRGLTGERVLVLQDGDRTGDLSSAAVDHLNAVDPSSAERIEVIRGPASLLYGNNALGGVVNVISNDILSSIPSKLAGYVLGQGESATPGGVAGAGLTMPLGTHFGLTARGAYRDFSDVRVGGGTKQPNTSGTTNNSAVGGAFVGDHASLGVVYRQMNFEYGLPHPEGDEAVRLDGDRRMVQLQSTVGTHLASLSTVKVDGTAQWYNHSEIEPSGDVGTRFGLNSQTFNGSARTQFGRAQGAFGVQGNFRQYSPIGEEAFTPPANNNNVAAFVFQELPLSQQTAEEQSPRLQVGARFDRFTMDTKPPADQADRFGPAQTRTFDNFAWSLGASIPIATDVSLTANASRGFRAPSVEELFANGYHAAVGTFDVGNPDLEPEKSTGFEAGLRAQRQGTFAQVSAYYNMIGQYIRPVAVGVADVDDNEVPLVNFRQDDAVLMGFEGQIEKQLPQHLVGGVMGDYTRATFSESNDNLPYIPAGRVGASLRYDNGRWSAGGEARRVFAQNRVSGDALDVATDAYTLINVNATWLFTVRGGTVHSLTLRADNLLDEQYRDATSRIKSYAYNPGRNLSAVYKLMF